jgi:hypothetical protein
VIYLTRTYLALEENEVPCEQKWWKGLKEMVKWRDDEDEELGDIFIIYSICHV